MAFDTRKIQTVSEATKWYRVMLFGDPGVGKTSLAATAPKPLIIDVEDGAKVLMARKETADTPFIPVKRFSQVEEIANAARKGELDEYETLVIDTFTEFQKVHIDEILKEEAAKPSARKNREYLTEQQDFNLSTQMMRRIILLFKDVPKHFIITAHSIDETDSITGRTTTRPALTPKLYGTVVGLMDVTAFIEAETDRNGVFKQKAIISPTKRYKAKNRLGMVGEIENPTWKKLIGEDK